MWTRSFWIAVSFTVITCLSPLQAMPAFAEDGSESGETEAWEKYRHHLSVIGGLSRDSSEDGPTLGVDYEYRVNQPVGLGFVVEHAFDDLKVTTILGVADLHIWRGLAVQVGPGIELVEGRGEEDDEEEFVYRIGALYEFEMGRFTVSPQLHYDFTTGSDTLVALTAVGFYF